MSLRGGATFITGSTIVGGKNLRTRAVLISRWRNSPRRKGDVIVIPAGTPYWFKTGLALDKLLRSEGAEALEQVVSLCGMFQGSI